MSIAICCLIFCGSWNSTNLFPHRVIRSFPSISLIVPFSLRWRPDFDYVSSLPTSWDRGLKALDAESPKDSDCVKSPMRCHPRERGDPYHANIAWIPTFVGMTIAEVLVFTQSGFLRNRLRACRRSCPVGNNRATSLLPYFSLTRVFQSRHKTESPAKKRRALLFSLSKCLSLNR